MTEVGDRQMNRDKLIAVPRDDRDHPPVLWFCVKGSTVTPSPSIEDRLPLPNGNSLDEPFRQSWDEALNRVINRIDSVPWDSGPKRAVWLRSSWRLCRQKTLQGCLGTNSFDTSALCMSSPLQVGIFKVWVQMVLLPRRFKGGSTRHNYKGDRPLHRWGAQAWAKARNNALTIPDLVRTRCSQVKACCEV